MRNPKSPHSQESYFSLSTNLSTNSLFIPHLIHLLRLSYFSLRIILTHYSIDRYPKMSFLKDMTEPEMKRARQSESERDGSEDRLSGLPDCVILHILSFVRCKDAVRTCVLSSRWKHLWKSLPTLVLHASDFGTVKIFGKFVSRLLSIRDGSVALHTLDFKRHGSVEPHILKKVLNYAISHNVQQLGIDVEADIDWLLPSITSCIFSCQTLTSLKLSAYCQRGTLFPKSLKLTALTNLHLCHFVFCASADHQAEPFSACHRLNNLIIDYCTLRDVKTLSISCTMLSSLTIRSRDSSLYKIVLSTPNLRSFAFAGIPCLDLSGSSLSSLEQVNIDADACYSRIHSLEPPLILLNWLKELANVQSLTVTANTLQVLFLVPDLLKMKLPSLGNLKSLKVKTLPLSFTISVLLGLVRLRARKKPYSNNIPDGILDFLLQNSPSAQVTITKSCR